MCVQCTYMATIDTSLTTSGNSAAVRLPRELLRMSGISSNSKVKIEAKKGKIIISKSASVRSGWAEQIKELLKSDKDPTQKFKDMELAAQDGLDDLTWNGPSFEEWQRANDKLS